MVDQQFLMLVLVNSHTKPPILGWTTVGFASVSVYAATLTMMPKINLLVCFFSSGTCLVIQLNMFCMYSCEPHKIGCSKIFLTANDSAQAIVTYTSVGIASLCFLFSTMHGTDSGSYIYLTHRHRRQNTDAKSEYDGSCFSTL